MSHNNKPGSYRGAYVAWQGYRPVRIRPPERDAAGNTETPLSEDEKRVAIRDGWSWAADSDGRGSAAQREAA